MNGLKKLIVYDLDGTLAESKSSHDAEISTLVLNLPGVVKAAVKRLSGRGSRCSFHTPFEVQVRRNKLLKQSLPAWMTITERLPCERI